MRLMMQNVQTLELWVNLLLQTPVPEIGHSRVELCLYPTTSADPPRCLTFALPDKSRFSLCDFPLHLSLELLGVSKCLQVIFYGFLRLENCDFETGYRQFKI